MLSKPMECTTAKMSPNVNYTLWVIMIWQCRFIDCKKHTSLVQDVDSGGGSVSVGAGGIWDGSVISAQFCYEPKATLKNKLYLKEKGVQF